MSRLFIIGMWVFAVALARMVTRSWSSPGCVLSIVFTAATVGATLLAPAYQISLSASFYLVLVAMATTLGATLAEQPSCEVLQKFSMTVSRRKLFIAYGYVCSVVSLSATLRAIGLSFSGLISPGRLAGAVQAATHQRYTEGLSFPLYYNIANAMVLSYAIVVAIQFTVRRRFDTALVPPILIFVIANLVITTRAPLIFMVLTMGFASLYARKTLTNAGLAPTVSFARLVRLGAVVGAFVIGIFFLFEQLRFGAGNQQSASELWIHTRKWPFGGVPAFSAWYSSGRPIYVQNPPGYYTFMGIYDTAGIARRQVGTFADYVYLTPGESTNVYTVFRGMIADYGRLGTIFVMAVLGFVGNAAARQRLFPHGAGLAIYVAVYTYLAFSLFSSYWAYTSNILAVLLVAPLMKLVCTGIASRETNTAPVERPRVYR